jgi:hypothetical protein
VCLSLVLSLGYTYAGTAGSHLHLDRIEQFIRAVGCYEDKIFQARTRKTNADKRRFLSRKAEQDGQGDRSERPKQPEAQRAGLGLPQPNMVDPKAFLEKGHGDGGSRGQRCNVVEVPTSTAIKQEGAQLDCRHDNHFACTEHHHWLHDRVNNAE